MTDLIELNDEEKPEGDNERPDGDGDARSASYDRQQKARPVAKILYDSRTILLFGEVTDKLAREVITQLIAMGEDSDEMIRLVISSPGGHVESGDAIHDMIRFITPPVKIVGTGWVASAGVHILLAAEKENRLCTPNTRFLLHQPMGGIGGRASEIEIEAREILKTRSRLNKVISDETGQTLERVESDTNRNYWMTPEEAIAYGIVNRVVQSIGEVK